MATTMKAPVSGMTIKVRSGWLIVDTSTAVGGITYDRTPILEKNFGRAGLEKQFKTKKIVDHVEACAKVDAVVHKADYLMKKYCTRTTFGWFADDYVLETIKAEVVKLREEMDDANRFARLSGSTRRGRIAIVPAKLEHDGEDAVREVARTVYDTLCAIRDCLVAGEIKNPLTVALDKARNLDRLAVGVQATTIAFALERAASARKEIRERVKTGEDAETVGKSVDLSAIDAALDMFSLDERNPYTNVAAQVASTALDAAEEE